MEKELKAKQPLHELVENSNLNLLEAALPYIEQDLKQPLALYIKLSEMFQVMHGFQDKEMLVACGLDDQNINYEMMLQAMRMAGNPEQTKRIDQLMQLINLSKMLPSLLENAISQPQSQPPKQTSSFQNQMDLLKTVIAPEKLHFIQSFIENNQQKSPQEMLPQIMQLSKQMKEKGLSFEKNEMELLLDIMKESMSPEEKQQIDMVLQLLK